MQRHPTKRTPATLFLCAALSLLAAHPAAGQSLSTAQGDRASAGEDFDFYVLALSWSPTYCLTDGNDGSPGRQCRDNADYGFIVHGLWPQFEDGYPEFCPTHEPQRVPAELGRRIIDIAPSMGLIGHMWRKHGSCTGLSQADYLQLVRTAHDRVQVPAAFENVDTTRNASAEAVEAAFMSDNPGLESNAISVVCDGGRLEEVRICMTPDLDFRACRQVDRTGCRADALTVPPQ